LPTETARTPGIPSASTVHAAGVIARSSWRARWFRASRCTFTACVADIYGSRRVPYRNAP